MNRELIVLSAAFLAGSVLGCGSGEPRATEEQKKDPAWVQSKLKEMDKDASLKPATPKK